MFHFDAPLFKEECAAFVPRVKRLVHAFAFVVSFLFAFSEALQAQQLGENTPANLSFGRIERISLTPSGAEPDAPSFGPQVSANGRYVLFASRAGNLLPGMPPGNTPSTCANPILMQWYVFDRQLNRLERASRNALGEPLRLSPQPPGCALEPYFFAAQITADGRYVFFGSEADNMPRPQGARGATYRFDRTTGEITVRPGFFRADDRYRRGLTTCGESFALRVQLCFLDSDTNELRPVAIGSNGETLPTQYPSGQVRAFDVSGDGRFVFFSLLSTEPEFLPENVTEEGIYVVRMNIDTGEKRIISRDANGPVPFRDIVNFRSLATNFDGSIASFNDRLGFLSVWRESTGVVESPRDLSSNEPYGLPQSPSFSDNGELLVYWSVNSFGGLGHWIRRNTGPGPSGQFIRDTIGIFAGRLAGTDCDWGPSLPINDMGDYGLLQSNYYHTCGQISGTANAFVFLSRSPNLVAGDTSLGLTNAQLSDREDGILANDIFLVPIVNLGENRTIPTVDALGKSILAFGVLLIGLFVLRRGVN